MAHLCVQDVSMNGSPLKHDVRIVICFQGGLSVRVRV